MIGILLLVILLAPFIVYRHRFELWVERTDWRRADRGLKITTTFTLFVVAWVLLLAAITAVCSGAIDRAVR